MNKTPQSFYCDYASDKNKIVARNSPHPSITSMTIITRRVVSISFYRLTEANDNVYVIDIDSYRFIERFSDINFYRLPMAGYEGENIRKSSKFKIRVNSFKSVEDSKDTSSNNLDSNNLDLYILLFMFSFNLFVYCIWCAVNELF